MPGRPANGVCGVATTPPVAGRFALPASDAVTPGQTGRVSRGRARLSDGLLARYRGTGADLPGQNPARSHPGVAMEGYFWRITDPVRRRVVIALIGVNDGPGGTWATVGLAASNGFLHTAAVPGASAHVEGLGAHTTGFAGSATGLRLALADDAWAELTLEATRPWPRRLFGGSSVFHSVPRLNQYWHPWLLTGRASGTVRVGDETWTFTDAQLYGEKNWGAEGFPDAWWWGQAHGFADPGACVAFAGGQVHARPLGVPLRPEVTALVVLLPDGQLLRWGDPGRNPVHARVGEDSWQLRARDRLTGWEVTLDAAAPVGEAHVLPVPLPSQTRNVPGALEHLTGSITVTVTRAGRTRWRGTSTLAGLERGSLALAAAELARRGGDPRPRAGTDTAR